MANDKNDKFQANNNKETSERDILKLLCFRYYSMSIISIYKAFEFFFLNSAKKTKIRNRLPQFSGDGIQLQKFENCF